MKNKFSLLFSFLIFNLSFAQQIVGSWMGELEIQATKLPLIVNIKQVDSVYSATLDSPLQGAEGIPVDRTTFKNKELFFEIKKINASFKGILNNSEIKGNFSQNGMVLPLLLKPFDKAKHQDGEVENLSLADISESSKKMDEYLSYLEKNNALAGEISVFKEGKEVYKKTFGEKNLPDFKNSNTVFQIGSITKTMTAIMIFKMIEEKKLNLDTTLDQFFPQIPNAKKITIAQLLHHSSGLGDYIQGEKNTRWLVTPQSEKAIIDRIIQQGSLFEPGTGQQYSNSGYYLLTKILEKVSDKSYSENLKKYIINPLKLKDFYTASQKSSVIYPSFLYDKKWVRVKDFDFNNVVGVGDIATTPYQLNIIINSIFDKKIISKESLHEMMPDTQKFGMGLSIVPFYGKIFVGHSGGTYGTNSLMIYNGEENISISYSLNADRTGIAGNEFAVAILSFLYGKKYDLPKIN
ncbi:serine hydrolase domain-containing protein [Chryseobacterium oryzae]|uniref:Beta-lactamase family protein n=1 Tax=Chryseobacterium oryzae TaxID=2929799 RepID=A0ABY4BM69_9FLAO|nr:serine hydrolase domain-containing protein [Chryseobacterium oryzae]UOE38951.1 beta-lactamase family protein [Chryseobacterium oryzae]